LLASASRDRLVRLWDGSTGTAVASLSGHADEVLDVTFSPDGRHLASAGRDQTVRLWSLQNFEELAAIRGFQGPIYSLDFSPTEMILAISGATREGRGQLRLWYGDAAEKWTKPAPASSAP
jgi:WD40 repeat protein